MNTSNEDKSASRYLGLMVRAMRKQRQLTQENLSEKTDIGVQYLSRIENGSANPTLKIVSAMPQHLKSLFQTYFLVWKRITINL